VTKYAKELPKFRRNLAKVYARRTETDNLNGLLWYESARVFCSDAAAKYGHSVATSAAVTAALSPQCRWERNIIIADDVLGYRAVSIGGALHKNIRNAQTLRDTQATDTRAVFRDGPKVFNFALNLAGDCNAVTVDTHAVQAAYDDILVNVWLRSGPYDVFASAYREVAATVKVAPCDFQAIVWHVWKRENPHKQPQRAQWSAMGEY